jgi:hypothetical protein
MSRWKGPTRDLAQYSNPRSFVYHEQYMRKCLAWAIKHIDDEVFETNQFNGMVQKTIPAFFNLRHEQIPKMLAKYVEHKVITPDQATTLLLQTTSSDRADWFIAFTVIKQIKNLKKSR